ncbi:MAG TPA: DUF459 domain-containing protein [Gaiellaceae bacterium]|nr:DUF459 domain-containing protein [Gaiellaceae bacterium]
MITRRRQPTLPSGRTAAERSELRRQARQLQDDQDGAGPPPRRRRVTSAWRALAIALAGVVLGLLLDAPGLHKSAVNQPEGWQRSVAVELTGRLDRISHAVYLDRPRAELKSALGRAQDDRIDTNIDIPIAAAPVPTTTNGEAATQRPPGKTAFSPAHPLRLWVAGDSLVISPGYALLRAVDNARSIKSVGGVDGQVATGLERPDVFNWFTSIREKLKELKPSVVVLTFGANDDKGYMTGLPKGVTVSDFGDPAWEHEYARRVAGVLDLINRAGAYTVWIGLPFTRDPGQSARFERINAIVGREIVKRPNTAAFVQTDLLMAGRTGGFAQYLRLNNGETVDARAPDGVHFSADGGAIVAEKVVEQLYRKFDLTSWRRHRTNGATATASR